MAMSTTNSASVAQLAGNGLTNQKTELRKLTNHERVIPLIDHSEQLLSILDSVVCEQSEDKILSFIQS